MVTGPSCHRAAGARRRQAGQSTPLVVALVLVLAVGVALGLSLTLALRASLGRHVPTPALAASAPPETTLQEGLHIGPPAAVRDAQGRQGTVEVVIVSRDYAWQLGSSSAVERHGQPRDDLLQHLRSEGVRQALARYMGIIAVGAASSEGSRANPLREETLARHRADELQKWIKESVPSEAELHTLSMGYYQGADALRASADQRVVVVIGIVHRDPGIDWRSALQDVLHTHIAFPMPPHSYSRFEVNRVR